MDQSPKHLHSRGGLGRKDNIQGDKFFVPQGVRPLLSALIK